MLIAKNSIYSQDLTLTKPIGSLADDYFKLDTVTINFLVQNSTYWLIHGLYSNKKVKLSTTLITTKSYINLKSIVIGNGTPGCGSLNWDGINYIDFDNTGIKCWAYPINNVSWYDMSPDGFNPQSSGVIIWLK